MKEYHFVKKRKQFLRGGDYYRGSSTPASRFRTKKSRSPSYQNLPYIMLKRRFAFLYASTSLHTKTLTVASNRNFESFLPIRCVAPQHILRFFAAGFAFAFAFGNSARYCVVLLSALLSDREKKKSWLKWVCFHGKSWSIVIDARRSHCLIVLRVEEAR